VEELKEAVKAARLEYKREQNLMTLRPPMEEQPPNKRRRLAEDLDLEERQIALEHQKAKNAREIKERDQDLREREATFNQNLREREATFNQNLREREATFNQDLRERDATLRERDQNLRERDQNLREREAKFEIEMEERKLSLREREAKINNKIPIRSLNSYLENRQSIQLKHNS
jgi:hypothetical protein